MAELTIVTWLWGAKYGPHYVERLERGLARNLKSPYRFLVIEPDPKHPLLREPGCLVRLVMFDPQWQARHGITGRLVCLDLDLVITGALDHLFDRPESFCILQGANAVNPCPYNGSVIMLRAGSHARVWREFSMVKAHQIPFFQFPDDQAWLAYKLPHAAGWKAGAETGIWSFRKRGWPLNDQLPAGARMVCFPGGNDPGNVERLPWIQQHWR